MVFFVSCTGISELSEPQMHFINNVMKSFLAYANCKCPEQSICRLNLFGYKTGFIPFPKYSKIIKSCVVIFIQLYDGVSCP